MIERTKELHGVKTAGLAMTDGDWDLVKSRMVNPDNFEKGDIRIFESRLANNFIDRDKERFSLPVLKSFAKTIVDKSILTGHQRGVVGNGRVYKAWTEKMTMEETLAAIGAQPEKGLQKVLAKLEKDDGGIYWLMTRYYMLADDPMAAKIDAGIVKDMSIGFRAPLLAEVKLPDSDKIQYWEWQNSKEVEAEAIEQSFVFLGAQYGSQTSKEATDIKDEPTEQAPEAEDIKSDETINTGGIMLIEMKALSLNFEVDSEKPDSVAGMVAAVEAKFAEATAAADAVKNELAQYKAVLGDATVAGAKVIAEDAKAYKAWLVDETVKYGALCGLIEKDQVEARREKWMKAPAEDVVERLNEYKKLFNERNPQTAVITDEPKPEAKQPKVNKRYAEQF